MSRTRYASLSGGRPRPVRDCGHTSKEAWHSPPPIPGPYPRLSREEGMLAGYNVNVRRLPREPFVV